MALVRCPECGKEISDKAISCPGCGFPITENVQVEENIKSDLDRLADEIWKRNPVQRVNAIKELQKATGMDLKSAKEAMDKRYNSKEGRLVVKEIREKEKEERRKNSQELGNAIQTLNNIMNGRRGMRCPKCNSTSISTDIQRLSIGRAIVGDIVAGAPGAIVGGLTSNKRYAVCLNCGKRWKV